MFLPQLSTIEPHWRIILKMKNSIKSHNPDTVDKLHNTITSAYRSIITSDCEKYFGNTREFAPKAMRREDF